MLPRRHPYLNVDPHQPPAGWHIASGILQVDRTVRGYYVRKQDVTGRCHTRDCRRTCHIDFPRLHADGLGALRIDQLRKLYSCQRLDGCGIIFHDDPKGESLKLSTLCGRRAVTVELRCPCGEQLRISPEHMIERLRAEKKGGGDTEVRDLAAHLSGACKKCRQAAWRVEVSWPDPNSWGGKRMIELAQPTVTGPIDPLEF